MNTKIHGGRPALVHVNVMNTKIHGGRPALVYLHACGRCRLLLVCGVLLRHVGDLALLHHDHLYLCGEGTRTRTHTHTHTHTQTQTHRNTQTRTIKWEGWSSLEEGETGLSPLQ